jgi:hypothetical protein
MMSTLTSFAAIEPTEVFLDETDCTEFIKFVGAKLLVAKVDKIAVEIALHKVVGMKMSSFKIPAELEAGKAADLTRRNKEIADAFRAQNEELMALAESMPNGTAAERLEIQKQNVKIASLKKTFVVE